jgi:hypothetical protein
MIMASNDISTLADALGVLQREMSGLHDRVLDLERRLADSDKRAAMYEQQANRSRAELITMGQRLEAERVENTRRLTLVAQDAQNKLNKLLIIIQSLYVMVESSGMNPNVDLEALSKYIMIDNVTGKLGKLDAETIRRIKE